MEEDLPRRLRACAQRICHAEGEQVMLEAANELEMIYGFLRQWHQTDGTPDFIGAEEALVAYCQSLLRGGG